MFLEKRVLSVFKYSSYLKLYKKSEKTNDAFLRKIPASQIDGQTDRETDRQTGRQTDWQINRQTLVIL